MELTLNIRKFLAPLALALLVFPGSAVAASSPLGDQYGNPTATTGKAEASQAAGADATDPSGLLPFTGGEFAALLGGIVLLGGSAYALRRASRPSEQINS